VCGIKHLAFNANILAFLKFVLSRPCRPLNVCVKLCTTYNAYDEFEQVLHENVGEQVDWSALAQMFRLTQTALQHTGTGSAAADQIQAFTSTLLPRTICSMDCHAGRLGE
jgi:hypothetical protein